MSVIKEWLLLLLWLSLWLSLQLLKLCLSLSHYPHFTAWNRPSAPKRPVFADGECSWHVKSMLWAMMLCEKYRMCRGRTVELDPDWCFGTCFMTFHSVGNFIIPTDELTNSIIFQRGRWLNHQPGSTRLLLTIINQYWPYNHHIITIS
jgi:hypothetical protein